MPLYVAVTIVPRCVPRNGCVAQKKSSWVAPAGIVIVVGGGVTLKGFQGISVMLARVPPRVMTAPPGGAGAVSVTVPSKP